jgi:hypothetical protein
VRPDEFFSSAFGLTLAGDEYEYVVDLPVTVSVKLGEIYGSIGQDAGLPDKLSRNLPGRIVLKCVSGYNKVW